MGYFNYHGKAKKLIREGHCLKAIIQNEYKKICPALILYFDNHQPMPIRINRFEEYIKILQENNIQIIK